MPHRIDRDKFFSQLISKPDTNCMEWPGQTKNGYGLLNSTGGRFKTHRLAAYFAGMIPHPRGESAGLSDQNVLHKCDNKLCCNPEHLFVGTTADNNADMWAKGRGSTPTQNFVGPPKHKMVGRRRKSNQELKFGERHKSAKLTNEQVETIRLWWAAGMYSQGELAKMFGIRQPTISLIVREKSRVVCG